MNMKHLENIGLESDLLLADLRFSGLQTKFAKQS